MMPPEEKVQLSGKFDYFNTFSSQDNHGFQLHLTTLQKDYETD